MNTEIMRASVGELSGRGREVEPQTFQGEIPGTIAPDLSQTVVIAPPKKIRGIYEIDINS